MTKKIETIKDIVELYHDHGLHIPTRTIDLCAVTDDEGDELGVSYDMSTRFIRNLRVLETLSLDPVTIIMNTRGGDAEQGMAIYDAIKASKCHVSIKVYGSCMSMGTYILQAADEGERVLSPHSTFMIHMASNGAGETNVYENAGGVNYDVRYIEMINTILYDRINEKRAKDNQAPMSKNTFMMMMFKGRYMMAQEAVDLGLADRIE